MSLSLMRHRTPVGTLRILADNDHLHAVTFESNWERVAKLLGVDPKMPVIAGKGALFSKTTKQLDRYFAGKATEFDLPVKLNGTKFQTRTWNALRGIPFGETRSYRQIAVAVKTPSAARAIGRAAGLNPLCIVLPCHRVIGSSGAITGYAGGVAVKRKLLELEGVSTK